MKVPSTAVQMAQRLPAMEFCTWTFCSAENVHVVAGQFKLITASAGLEEGSITASTTRYIGCELLIKGENDIEYEYPIGWSELEGVANRGDYDLTRHAEFSGTTLEWFGPEGSERYVPWVIGVGCGSVSSCSSQNAIIWPSPVS